MSGVRFGTLADGLWHLHRTPDLAAMRAARSPDELARLALVPAARNLGIAAGFLPADLRSEATAALLACRVLDAYATWCWPSASATCGSCCRNCPSR